MLRTTRQNVGKHMAVVLIEKHQETATVNGKKVTREVTTERVINDATIQSVFGDRFEITGLSIGRGAATSPFFCAPGRCRPRSSWSTSR